MQSVYMAVRVRPFSRLPPREQSGSGPSTLISPAIEREGIAAFDAVPLEGLAGRTVLWVHSRRKD